MHVVKSVLKQIGESDSLQIYKILHAQESSPTPQFKNIYSLAFSFLYGPTLTSIHEYWKNHSFD